MTEGALKTKREEGVLAREGRAGWRDDGLAVAEATRMVVRPTPVRR
jgi:hypothetical protein